MNQEAKKDFQMADKIMAATYKLQIARMDSTGKKIITSSTTDMDKI